MTYQASIAIITVLCFVSSSCLDRDKKGNLLDTPTSGMLNVVADESLKPLLDSEAHTFGSIYSNADVTISYGSEKEAVEALLKDSVRLIVITRNLTREEADIIEQQKIIPQQITIAKEGVALILNRNNPDTLFHLHELRNIITGKISDWRSLNASVMPSNLELIFDHPSSGIVRFLNDSVAAFDRLPPFCFAVHGNPSVVDYVSKKVNAIGLIGASWISDSDDSTANRFLSSVRVAALSDSGDFYQPYQAYIAQDSYPLVRKIIMISREARTGLASGFIAFVAGEKGQRIVLKAGLVPSTMPLRIVEINHEPLQ